MMRLVDTPLSSLNYGVFFTSIFQTRPTLNADKPSDTVDP